MKDLGIKTKDKGYPGGWIPSNVASAVRRWQAWPERDEDPDDWEEEEADDDT